MTKNPNIERFNQKVRDLGLELDDPRINVRQLFRAYTEGREPELKTILYTAEQMASAQSALDSDEDMDVTVSL